MEAIETLESIVRTAKERARANLVRYGTLSPGDTHRQGDLYIMCLAALPASVVCTQAQKQLVPGSTQGSRHALDSLEGVEFYSLLQATQLDGPVLVLTKRRTVTHPEHGHVSLPPGVYAVTYQRQYAEKLRRVQD
jgi:hypothetical protein